MPAKPQDHPHAPAASSFGSGHADRFVERMFSGFGHALKLPLEPSQPLSEQSYQPLRQLRARPGAAYRLQTQTHEVRVRADSPATDVMTDLTRVAAVKTRSDAGIDEARQTMITHGVRALFVVDESTVLGIITSTDILGEKPIQVAQQRGIRHDEVLVRELMMPAELLEAMELTEVLRARVGDIVASLRLSNRQHALVIESAPAGATPPTHLVRGVFSLTQIARQLGLPPQSGHDVARTFAEIEAAIGA
jgi:CBS domain-containing protein